MVSLAVGVLCSVCLVTLRLAAAQLHARQLFVRLFAAGSRTNSYALTTGELSDYHSAQRKSSHCAGNIKG
ncbi:MAG: hypothetical protein H0T92_07400 [Pyrinomonadaceae bacterium]|nr:hypothetical protein [Pyrinomonadaceae bacterium]